MTYFSDAQLPKSSSRHRSLQKGILGSPKGTSLPQIGHRMDAPISLLSDAETVSGVGMENREGVSRRLRRGIAFFRRIHQFAY